MLGFCSTRVSESVSNAFTVAPLMLTAKFDAFMFASVFSVKFEGVVVVPVVVEVLVLVVVLFGDA
jgi:hypothetical protein